MCRHNNAIVFFRGRLRDLRNYQYKKDQSDETRRAAIWRVEDSRRNTQSAED